MKKKTVLFASSLSILFLTLFACSSTPKTTPELGKLRGKKVALVEIEGEQTSKAVVETALVNQLVSNGTFILVNKREVDAARAVAHQDPTDWKGIARGAGADLAMRVKVLKFHAEEKQGYSSEIIDDETLEAETGDGKTERLYKVRALEGSVLFEISFYDLEKLDLRTATAASQDRVIAESRTRAARLPPRLRFLEELSNKAFADFFKQYSN